MRHENDKKDTPIMMRTCSTCTHQDVCGAFSSVSKTITNSVQFDVRLIALNAVYQTLAKHCREYERG